MGGYDLYSTFFYFLRFCSSHLEKLFLLEYKWKKFQGAVADLLDLFKQCKNALLEVTVILHFIKF